MNEVQLSSYRYSSGKWEIYDAGSDKVLFEYHPRMGQVWHTPSKTIRKMVANYMAAEHGIQVAE